MKKIITNLFQKKKTQEKVVFTILFADIASSTRLYDTLGDKLARTLVSSCISCLSDATSRHGGNVIKTLGDGMMSTFRRPSDAVEAAVTMQDKISEMQGIDTSIPDIRIGVHTGPVIHEDNDIFGDAVNVAARVADLAKQRQILITKETRNGLSSGHQNNLRHIDRTTVKGKTDEIDIYELMVDENEATFTVPESMYDAMDIPLARMIVRHNDQEFEICHNRPVVKMGRHIHNDIVVESDKASRFHAKIEFRRSSFVLIDDFSTNGSYLKIKGKPGEMIRRDKCTIYGEGIIGLGKEVTSHSPEVIHFKIKLAAEDKQD